MKGDDYSILTSKAATLGTKLDGGTNEAPNESVLCMCNKREARWEVLKVPLLAAGIVRYHAVCSLPPYLAGVEHATVVSQFASTEAAHELV